MTTLPLIFTPSVIPWIFASFVFRAHNSPSQALPRASTLPLNLPCDGLDESMAKILETTRLLVLSVSLLLHYTGLGLSA